ncbi:MAG: SOS response-associated peptidase [Blastocatellia bacterium]
MCGRYTLYHKLEEIEERFDVDFEEDDYEPRYNIAPSQPIVTIRRTDARRMARCKWGLVPYWAKDPAIGNKMINARAETLAEKPSFRQALAKRRCLIPADGFYEWKKEGKAPSRPIHIRRRDRGLFAFAGLWEEWKAPDGAPLQTCTIITTEPNELLAQFHHRMAVILRPEEEALWLDPDAPLPALLPLLRPSAAGELEAFEVSQAVNKTGFDDPSCIEPARIETQLPLIQGSPEA